MARIVYCHPSQTKYDYHIFTDLDFWDARRLLRDIVPVRRNFGRQLSGDEFPTQVVANYLARPAVRQIEKRLRMAVISPPRHVIVRSMVFDGHFEFDPHKYYPSHWSPSRMIHFTFHRLPLQQGALCNPYQTVQLSWVGDKILVTRVQREKKHDPVIRTLKEAKQALAVPSCF
jgi:hypothetical protein